MGQILYVRVGASFQTKFKFLPSSINHQFDYEISVVCILLSSHARLGSNNTAILISLLNFI